MVFYRKYRPQKIEELDSKEVRERLFAILSSKSISHAFLFTGPKGLGKTSAARIVAKVVNCLAERDMASPDEKVKSSEGIEPCNKCHQCTSITKGTNLDVLEIDGASNRGIDEIRDLREKVKLSPASANKKVYIIDEVHMLTTEAFNALLKTLEEPPSHVIFILCTTEPQKLPETIISRCSHIPFEKAKTEELTRSFKRIAKSEGLNIDEEALGLVASLSDGSFRDGAKILEEMKLVSDGKKITKELVEKKYQIRQLKDQIREMIKCLSEKDAKQGLQLVTKLVEQGVDMKYFLEQLISELHEMLLIQVGVARGPVKENSEFRIQNSEMGVEEIKELVDLLSGAYRELKYAVLPQLPLEMVIVEWSLASLGSPHPLNDSSDPGLKQSASLARAEDIKHASEYSLFKSSFRGGTRPADYNKISSQTDNFWQELINKVKAHNQPIAGVLRGCSLKEYDGKNLVIETKFKFHKDRLDDIKVRGSIEDVSSDIAGNKVKVSVLLKNG